MPSEVAAQEVDLQGEQVLGHDLLWGHVGDARQRQELVRPMRRWRPDPDVEVAIVDSPRGWDALEHRPSRTLPGTHLTLRGALTIDRATDDPDWPWDVAGVWWTEPVPGTPLAEDERGTGHHDHAWVPIGRPHDPRFDEGDEIDGSDLTG